MFNETKIAQKEAKTLLAPLSPEEVNEKYVQVINALDSFTRKESFGTNDSSRIVLIFTDLLEVLRLLNQEQKDEIKLRILNLFDKLSGEEILLSALVALLVKIHDINPIIVNSSSSENTTPENTTLEPTSSDSEK